MSLKTCNYFVDCLLSSLCLRPVPFFCFVREVGARICSNAVDLGTPVRREISRIEKSVYFRSIRDVRLDGVGQSPPSSGGEESIVLLLN